MTLEERLAALEARVKQLEAQVGTPVSGPNIDVEMRLVKAQAEAERMARVATLSAAADEVRSVFGRPEQYLAGRFGLINDAFDEAANRG